MDCTTLNDLLKTYKEPSLFGRYIKLSDIKPLIHLLPSIFKKEVIGNSVLGDDVFSITVGSGPIKILMWSQMHGNESTTTKAIFDVLNTFRANQLSEVLAACTIKVIPMLNPDGAKAYTRLNANKVDLNRDAQDLSQPESVALRQCYDHFKPNFCFNLHGQRTMYSVADTNNTATLSFLSPSQDKERSVTKTRKQAMELINAINIGMQSDLCNQIGRYDDGFNLNCVGDTFQSLNTPTVLFEAGHYANDYNREKVRGFVYKSLVIALDYIAKNNVSGDDYEAYFTIPENGKLFYDIIIRNAEFSNQVLDVGFNYEEVLVDDNVIFVPKVAMTGDLSGFYGHKEIDAKEDKVFTTNNQSLTIGSAIDFVKIDNVKISLNL